MEFNSSILNQQAQPPVGRSGRGSTGGVGSKKPRNKRFKWLNNLVMLFLVAVALLIGAVVLLTSTSSGKNEIDLVDSDKFQAVFLEGGQVYFGKISTISQDYIALDNIFYLRVNEQGQENQNQDVSLSRLGCELHGPQDRMVITRSQVSFWENLKDDGQVVKAINEFNQQNPNGQTCPSPGSASQQQQSTPQAPQPIAPAINNDNQQPEQQQP